MKLFKFLLIPVCICFLNCASSKCTCDIDQQITIKNDSIINEITTIHGNDFKKYWENFNEPQLVNEEVESYRFSFFGLLTQYRKIYRVEKSKNKHSLYIKEFVSDSLLSNSSKEISEKEWLEIKNTFDNYCFWAMPVDIKDDDYILDGSGWTLEAKILTNNCINSNYKIVIRKSPPDSTDFSQICRSFMKLNPLNIK